MADRFMDGEPGVRRVKHQVIFARLDRRCGNLRLGLLGRGDRVFLHVIGLAVDGYAVGQHGLARCRAVQIFKAQAHGGGQAFTCAEFAACLIDGGDFHRRPDAVHVLVNIAAVGAGEIFLFVDEEQRGAYETGPSIQCGGVDAHQQIDLVLDRHGHAVLDDRCAPADFAHAFDRRELNRRALTRRIGLGDGDGFARAIAGLWAFRPRGNGQLL